MLPHLPRQAGAGHIVKFVKVLQLALVSPALKLPTVIIIL
jgi:hypothetical protein